MTKRPRALERGVVLHPPAGRGETGPTVPSGRAARGQRYVAFMAPHEEDAAGTAGE